MLLILLHKSKWRRRHIKEREVSPREREGEEKLLLHAL